MYGLCLNLDSNKSTMTIILEKQGKMNKDWVLDNIGYGNSLVMFLKR